MDATARDTSNDSTNTQQKIIGPRICAVCGAPAQYSYYGAIVCRSCKVFFRRNAEKRPTELKCHYDGNCEIDVNSRRTCSYCRLAKCFACGMTPELIRSSLSVKQKKKKKKKLLETQVTSTALVKVNEPALIPTLNLLRADQSTLSVDQWNQISNIVHCFDDYSGLSFVQNFIDEQNALPPKFRFKYTSMSNFFTSMMTNIQSVFGKNRDFISLSEHDRNILLHQTVQQTTTIGSACILRQIQLFDLPTFLETAEHIFRPSAVTLIKRLIEQLDPDVSLMKMICAVVAFMISNFTVHPTATIANLTDTKAIIRVQDMYTDLIWRYLNYKHNYHDALLCFNNLIKCLFLANDSVVQACGTQQYTDMMSSVIESTEQKHNPEN